MALRNYINGAPLLTLALQVDANAVTFEVSSTAGFPTSPFSLAIERATANEEVVLCSAKNATQFTVTRGWDGTTKKAHAIGSAIEHTTAAIDYVEANVHVNDSTTDVHSQYLLKSAYAAKGRVIVGTGDGTFVALPVGANNTVALADDVAASGVKWGQIVAASVADGVLTEAKMTPSVQQSLIYRATEDPGSTPGRVYFNTGDSRWYGYVGAWHKMTFGAGLISWGTDAPSGGADGDIYFRFT